MQQHTKTSIVVPLVVITLGLGWLLTSQGFAPSINWVWTLALGIVGILTFAVTGIDKFSVVVGPFFMVASAFSILRQVGYLEVNVEVPALVITIGFLLLLARLPGIPLPQWANEPEPRKAQGEKVAA